MLLLAFENLTQLMETHLQMLSLRDEEDEHVNTIEATKTEQLNPLLPSSSPSSSSSPPHEFSFTVPLEQSSTVKIPEKNSSLVAAVDLSPADEIFFHGHLLPLHSFFSHKPASPRSSTDSLDHCFTLPIDTTTSSTSDEYHHLQEKSNALLEQRQGSNGPRAKSKSKSKSFSTLFSLARLRRKESCQTRKRDHDQDDRTRKRKLKLDVIKKYMRLVKPFLVSLRSKKGVNHYHHHHHHQIHRSTYSFSGNLRMKSKKGLGEYSAPASMIHSPTYSGILVASGSVTPTYYNSTNNYSSTVEDLQEAIQAAIAHCKKSNGASEGRTLQPTVLST